MFEIVVFKHYGKGTVKVMIETKDHDKETLEGYIGPWTIVYTQYFNADGKNICVLVGTFPADAFNHAFKTIATTHQLRQEEDFLPIINKDTGSCTGYVIAVPDKTQWPVATEVVSF